MLHAPKLVFMAEIKPSGGDAVVWAAHVVFYTVKEHKQSPRNGAK